MPLNTLSQIFNTTAIKAIPNQNNNLLDFVGTSGTTVASVTAGGVLDLRATSGAVLGDLTSVIGNKIQLWANTFGIGIQNGRLVIYNDSGSATSIRTSLTGSDIIRFNNDGNLSTRFVDSLANSGAYLDMGVGTAGILVLNRNAGHVPLTVRGAVSQTSNIQEWQGPGGIGEILAIVTSNGNFAATGKISSGGTNSATQLNVVTINGTTIGAIIKGTVSQTADLQQWQNSSSSVLARVNSAGQFVGDGSQLTGISAGANEIMVIMEAY